MQRLQFNPWVGKIPWRRAGHPTPAFLPGESHGQTSLVGCSLCSCTKSDTAEATEQPRRCLALPALLKKKKSQRKWHLFLRFKIFEQPKSMAQTLLVINKRTEIHPNSFIPPSKATWQDIHTWTSKTGTYLSLQSLTKTDKLTVTLAPVALFWVNMHLFFFFFEDPNSFFFFFFFNLAVPGLRGGMRDLSAAARSI